MRKMLIFITILSLSIKLSNSAQNFNLDNLKSAETLEEDILKEASKNGSATVEYDYEVKSDEMLNNLNNTSNAKKNEDPNLVSSIADILQCCVIVLILMFILMLLSEWTDLSFLLQTSRHHMVIIEM